jgi:BRCT domain type II-containing protein
MSLSGKVVAISGKLSQPRNAIQAAIKANGGTFSSSVTKKVTHLIVGDPTATTTKIEKARKQGIEIVGEDWLTASTDDGNDVEEEEAPPSRERQSTLDAAFGVKKSGDTLPLAGMTICLTGRLSKKKEDYAQIIASNGGTFSNTVTKKVTHVVAKEPDAASSKLDKARKYGATVVGEELLLNLEMRSTVAVGGASELAEGETVLVTGSSGREYEVKKSGGVVYCTCPGWRNQSAPVNKPVGWWLSEKLDGVRAWWDGEKFWSRLGNMFYAPDWFREAMPKDHILDGELFMGRGMFQETISVVRSHLDNETADRWKDITYMVFDVPSHAKKPFEKRLEIMRDLCKDRPYTRFVEQRLVTEEDDLDKLLAEMEEMGGEGLMLRAPKSKYVGSRSNTLLKVKSFKDDEAKVIGYATEGKGRLKGMTGSLQVVNREGKKFKVGSGLTDELRRDPPPIGSIITYRYQELTNAGKPRFPTYVGLAIDKEFP